jgi:hypothetical protein
MSRKLALVLLPMLLGGCSLWTPNIPQSTAESDLVFFGRTPAFRPTARFGFPNNDQNTTVGDRAASNTKCPAPAMAWSGLGADPILIRCNYRLALSYLQDRLTSTTFRRDELTRIETLGKLGIFVGLAGAAGNAIFHGAHAANLSWGYGAATGYAAYQGFVPESLRNAYSTGSAAFACVLSRSEAAWAAAPTGDVMAQRQRQVATAARAVADSHAALTRAAQDPKVRPILSGSSAQGTQRAQYQDISQRLADLQTTVATLQAQRPTTSGTATHPQYEIALANAMVSVTDALAAAINLNIDRSTPLADQVWNLGKAIGANTADIVSANASASARADAANAGKQADPVPDNNPGGAAAEGAKPKVDSVANQVIKPPQQAAGESESADLQVAINNAIAAARGLQAALAANDPPDYKDCLPQIRASVPNTNGAGSNPPSSGK